MNPKEIQRRIERILPSIDKPARYIGSEFNTVVKPDGEVDVRVALAFPDVYDIGMSYHGFKIFYERVNRIKGVQCERVFAPWPDFEAHMRQQEVPLYLLESKRPVSDADIVGFTLQHEMNYTNILNMLDLSQIPMYSKDRGNKDPIVIAGGHGAFNPEVIAEFIDVFVVGDGEWALLQIIEAVRAAKAAWRGEPVSSPESDQPYHYRGDGTVAKRKAVPTFGLDDVDMPAAWKHFDAVSPALREEFSFSERYDREEVLRKLSKIPGVYVPAFYNPVYREDGQLASMERTWDEAPEVVTKSNFDVRDDYGCTKPVVPLMRVVHDRFAIEIKRGCMVGCRFCQAGMITRPLRERSPAQIVEIAREGIRNTGYDEISLLSLSSADYSGILELTRALRNELAEDNVSISLPSLRINAFDVDLADEIGSVRKSGFTFAPEAGTARLREVINKAVDEERFLATIESVLKKGWRTLKFYFMCGLPTETDEDLQGIVNLTDQAIVLGKKYCGNNFKLNISLSPFIPKPQTPFQWHAQPTIEEFDRRYNYVMDRINRRYVSLKKHSLKESVIEGVLGRGDRRIGQAIHRAWQLGCKFDNWHEHMQFDLWNQAFSDTGIDVHFFANRERDKDEVFAWDHIEASLGKKFLWKEKTKSELVKVTADCSTVRCATCEVCDFKEVKNLLSIREDGEYYAPPPIESSRKKNTEPKSRMRLTFSKGNMLRFLSHLDMVKVVQIIFRRASLELAYSQGFNPSPKMAFTPALPMGFSSSHEILDVTFTEEYSTEDVLSRLQEIHLDGLAWLDAEAIELRAPSMVKQLVSADYEITLPRDSCQHTDGEIEQLVRAYHEASEMHMAIPGKRDARTRDLKQSVKQMSYFGAEETHTWNVTVSLSETDYVNPLLAVAHLIGCGPDNELNARRTGFSLETLAV